MAINTRDLAKAVSKTSNEFEKHNSKLKKDYLIKNIMAFNGIASMIEDSMGTFGTGYPYYALGQNFTGELPVIKEQLRYNRKLELHAKNYKDCDWICAGCLMQNYDQMPDLKTICKPCPNMNNNLKPRKVINRLPDIDMWLVCKDGKQDSTCSKLKELLDVYNMHTSDVNPIKTIEEINEITESIKNGKMPDKFLPIDVHVIEYNKLKSLIKNLPNIFEYSKQYNQIPYIPINPISYRKEWQHDDEAYNFAFDYLYSFTPFNFDDDLNKCINNTRANISKSFSDDELYKFVYDMASDSVRRRMNNPKIEDRFKSKIQAWRKLDVINDKNTNDKEFDDEK